jgi:TRAP-type uncharacterized transport system substrate-binding protein
MVRRKFQLYFCCLALGLFYGLVSGPGNLSAQPAQGVTTRTPPRAPAATPAISMREEAKRRANDNVVTIMGSGRLTSYTQFAEDISNVIESVARDDMRVVPVLGKSAGHNIIDILQLRGIDMAFADQDALEYIKKKDPFLYGDIDKRINYIAKIFNAELHVYAKKNINSLEDLRGKKISCLKEGSTAAALCHNLFDMLKINVNIVYNSGDIAHQKILADEIAAAVDGAPAFDKMKPEEGLHFVPISAESLPNADFNPVRATYLPARLTNKDHPNMIAEGEEVPTIASSSILIVYAWPSNSQRYQTLRKFVDLFFSNIHEFRKPPRHAKWADVNVAADIPGWKRFPAAQEWIDIRRGQNAGVQINNDAKLKAAFQLFVQDYAKRTGDSKVLQQSDSLYAQFVQWWEVAKKP